MTTRLKRRLGGLALGALLATTAALFTAAPASTAPTEIRAIGYISNLYLWPLERDFFAGPFTEAAGDLARIELVPQDLAGIRGPELLQMLQDGTVQFASGNLTYASGEDPRFEALDLAGLSLTAEDARKAADAYKPVLSRVLEERFNIKLLALAPLPSQVFWCRDDIEGLAGLRDRKVRVFNNTLSDFVLGLGGTTVTIPFTEVVPALQRGIADCAVTGTSSGNTARWFEVTKTIYPMNVGWSTIFWGVNKDAWNSYSDDLRTMLTGQYGQLEDLAWQAQAAQEADALSCAVGGDCQFGVKANMTVREISAADIELRNRILRENVLPGWAARCGAECATEWNATVGAALGVEAPVK